MRSRLENRGGGRVAGIHPLRIWRDGAELALPEVPWPLVPRVPGKRVEIEIGFGKGRYLLGRALAAPEVTFVGIESARPYWRIAAARAQRGGLRNLVLLCGDALYLLATCVASAAAASLHVYFPDPWPKLRHHKRRLLDATTVDLVLGALAPGGSLYFATDHDEYGAAVSEVLAGHPGVALATVEGAWPDGARTNYETKYAREGRPIRRLIATRRVGVADDRMSLHPVGRRDVVAGV